MMNGPCVPFRKQLDEDAANLQDYSDDGALGRET
jgi:hypothetical protein